MGKPFHIPSQDIRWCAYRDPNSRRPALREIDCNFGAAVARANNQHVLVVIQPWVAVFHRMNHRSIECARPSRQLGKPRVSGGHHHHARRNGASGCPDTPVAVIAVNARDLNAEPRLEAMVCCVLLEVLHELVARHPAPEVTWNPVTRKMRE
jgi:hypothetical protein